MARDLVLNVHERRTGDALDREADALDRTGDSAERAGKKMEGMGRQSSRLDEEIRRLTTHIHDVRTEVDRTGKFELLDDKSFRDDQRRLSQLTRTLKAIGPQVGDEAGRSIVGGIADALATGAGAMRGAMMGILVGGVVAASPLIGAVIAAAVTGGVGVGGVAGGIALAARDSSVQAAAKDLGHEVFTDLVADAQVFVEPTIKALDRLGEAWDKISRPLRSDFDKIAPGVERLADGIAGLVEEFEPGLSKALDMAVPALQIMGEELPYLGKALGVFLEDVVRGEATLTSLRATLEILSAAIVATGAVIGALEEGFQDLVEGAAKVSGALEDIPIPGMKNAFAAVNDITEQWLGSNIQLGVAIGEVTEQEKKAARAAEDLKVKLDDLFEVQMSLDEATLHWNESLADVTEELNKGKRTLALNTEEGRKNTEALLNGISAAIDMRDAMVASGKGTDAANRAYQEAITKLEAIARKAGFSKQEIDKLVGNYEIGITYNIKTQGHVPNLHLGPNAGVTVDLPGRAAGGPVQAGMPYLVGEQGIPEVFVPDQNGMIVPPAGWGGGGGGDTYNFYIDAGVSDPAAIAERIRLLLRDLKRSKGGAKLGLD